MLQKVTDKGQVLAIIIRVDHRADGIEFFTPPGFSQQLAYMNRPKSYVIAPHVHNPVVREVQLTKKSYS